MIKIPYYSYFIILLSAIFFGKVAFGAPATPADSNVSSNANWLTIVQKRLELEQKPVEELLKGMSPEGKKVSLDNALLYYRKEFTDLYNEIMTIFKESDDWISLREYLIDRNKALDEKYKNLNDKYLIKKGLIGRFSEKELNDYQADLTDYYNAGMEMFKKVITEGQTKEVKLRKEEIKEMKKERRRKPEVESAIWLDEP